MAAVRARPLLPLPEEVVAQIKSSTAVVSLTGVVLELLKNSLDAGAANIEATVDFARGSCSVEDDGLGIAPLEFRNEGGLGKPYCTSKYPPQESCLGRNGAFLASLAAMSLLTITSHHHQHRSHNSITFHHSKSIERQIPAPARHELRYEKHGTRVTVRNLFGNMPVRVKHRAAMVEQKPEYDRLCATLKRDVTSLLLGWRDPVSLQIHDSDNKSIIKLGRRPSLVFGAADSLGSRTGESRPLHLQAMLNTLTQAALISIEDWPSWIPVSASTPNILINGAISLDPAPTKGVQFISLGIRSLSAEAGHNELYNEVNRLFGLSSFGIVEDNVVMEAGEKMRRQSDKRFKSDGYTKRQLRGKKGVDRYPMFHLCIALKGDTFTKTPEDQFFDNETNLQAVTEVLNAMITQWLTVHHFRPRKRRTRHERPNTASASIHDYDSQNETSSSGIQSPFHRSEQGCTASKYSSRTGQSRKRKRSATPASNKSADVQRQRPFAEWSRIKSSKAQFLDTLWTKDQRAQVGTVEQHTPIALQDRPLFDVGSILVGSLNSSVMDAEPQQDMNLANEEQTGANDDTDETMIWTDPTTKQTHILNSRTGSVVSQNFLRSGTTTQLNRSLRLQKRGLTSDAASTPWLDGLLQTWDNPIFKPAEKRIQQISLDDCELQGGGLNKASHSHCSRIDISKAFNGASISGNNKLSKEGLQNAQVIAQLDKKFILVKMAAFPDSTLDEMETLVVIDQHAADERVRVESLLTELCALPPNTSSQSQYQSRLGHRPQVVFTILEKPVQFSVSYQEGEMFHTHAIRFAAWGILFDLSSFEPPTAKNTRIEKSQPVITVTTLPPSISERCKVDPKLLISFLRSTVWKYAEEPHSRSLVEDSLPTSENEGSPLWLRRLSSCPPGLVDLINSRACRSAIMFNDELTIQQCEELVSKLSRCLFPFMCAHGRPSMVPLVELGGKGSIGLGPEFNVYDRPGKGNERFVDAWKKWKK